jgi:homoserine kinase
LHQPHRAHLYPRSMELVGRAPELGAVGASISGAGPTVLLWAPREGAARLLSQLAEEVPDWQVRRVSFEPEGATVGAVA